MDINPIAVLGLISDLTTQLDMTRDALAQEAQVSAAQAQQIAELEQRLEIASIADPPAAAHETPDEPAPGFFDPPVE